MAGVLVRHCAAACANLGLLMLLLVLCPHAGATRQHMPQPSPDLPSKLLCYEDLQNAALPHAASFTCLVC